MKAFIARHTSAAAVAAIALAGLQLCVGSAQAGSPIATDAKETAPITPVEDPWKFTLGIPGWLANTEGTGGVNGKNANVNVGVDTILKNLDMIASFSGEVRKGKFGIYGDFMYVGAQGGVDLNGVVKNVNVL